MLYTGLNNKEYKLNTSKFLKRSPNKSKLHLKVREFLKQQFSCYSILEEVSILGSSKGTLHFDFMCIQLKMCVECNGQQHTSHIKFFHPTKADFLRAKQRDVLKKQWCELNGFCLYEFEYNQDESDWNKILNGTTG